MSLKSKASSNTSKDTANTDSSNEMWAADDITTPVPAATTTTRSWSEKKMFDDSVDHFDDADDEDQDYDRFYGAGEGCSPPDVAKKHGNDDDVSDQEFEFNDLGLISCSSSNKANTQQSQPANNKKCSKFNRQRIVVLEDNDSDGSDYKDAGEVEKKPWAKAFNMIAPSPAAVAATAAKNTRIPDFAAKKKPFDPENDSSEDFFQSINSNDNDDATWAPTTTSTFKYKSSSGIPSPAPKKTWPSSTTTTNNNKYDSDAGDSWTSFDNDKNVARGAVSAKKVVKPPVKLPMATKKP